MTYGGGVPRAPLPPRASAASRLRRSAGALSTAATAGMEEQLPWFSELSAQDRSWVGVIVQAGVQNFVEWYAGSSQTYDIRQTRVMVQQAIQQVISGGDDPDVEFDVGTPVRYKFPKNWWNGKITSYDSKKGEYKVTWTDGSWNKYTDVKAVKQMVDQGAIWKVGYEDVPAQVYPIGSLVYTEFSEKFCKSTSLLYAFVFVL